MSTGTREFSSEKVGVAGEPVPFAVDGERIVAYARATNDEIPQHAAGEYAPPVFGAVVAFDALVTAMTDVIPPELVMMSVHVQHDLRLQKAIRPGTTLVTRAQCAGLAPRPTGVTVTARASTRDESGAVVVDQYMTSFVRSASAPGPVGTTAPGHPFPRGLRATDPLAVVEQRFDEDQTLRYAEASGDPMPIHTDEEVARAMGLPGIIVHGLCTMAFASRAVIQTACPGDPTRLERLAVRFSRPCLPGQTISTSIWPTEIGAYAYRSVADSGAVVIKDGLAEVRR